MACTIRYRGKNYTEDQLLQLIKSGEADSLIQGDITDPKLTAGGHKFLIQEKNELVSAISTKILQKLFEKNNIYSFIENNIETIDDQMKDFAITFRDQIAIALETAVEDDDSGLIERISALAEETFITATNDGTIIINPNSNLVELVKSNLAELGVKLKIDVIANEEEDINKIDDVNQMEQNPMVDAANYKASFEFDSKVNMPKAIKFMLASFIDTEEVSPFLGLPIPIKWNRVANTLSQELAEVPPNNDDVIERLLDISDRFPFIEELIEQRLGGLDLDLTTADPDLVRLRMQFIQSFGKNRYNFTLGLINEDNIYWTDQNINTAANKLVGEWRSNLLTEYDTMGQLVEALKEVTTDSDIADVLRLSEIIDNPNLLNEVISEAGIDKTVSKKLLEVKNAIINAHEKAEIPINRIYNHLRGEEREYNIIRSLHNMAALAAVYTNPVNLQIYNAEGKRIYNISLNTYQTLIVNELNYIAKRAENIHDIEDEAWYEAKVNLIKERLPHLVTPFTFNSETGQFTSLWLDDIANGIPINIRVFDGIKEVGKSGKSFSELNETDQLAFTINSVLKGMNPAMKHSDRSTFFAYSRGNNESYIYDTSEQAIKENTLPYLYEYLTDEIRRVQALKNDGVGSNIKLYNKNALDLGVFSFLPKNTVKGAINKKFETRKELRDYVEKNFELPLSQHLDTIKQQLLDKMTEWDLLNQKSEKAPPIGISNDEWQRYGANPEAIAMAVAANAMINHIEEIKVLVGDTAFYKNGDDLYKRLKMQSSTGEVVVVDGPTNKWVEREFIKTKDAPVYNPRTGERAANDYHNKPTDGSMSEIILEENKDIVTTNRDELKNIFTKGLTKSIKPILMQENGMTSEQADAEIASRVSAYMNAYDQINEQDGQSYLNIFGWKEMMFRAGKWNEQLENTFQLELAIASLASPEQLANLEMWVQEEYSKDKKTYLGIVALSATKRTGKGWSKKKVFDLQGYNNGSYKAREFLENVMSSGTVLKPQYTGPMMTVPKRQYDALDSQDRLSVIAGRKTSYFVMMPSSIIGTKLQYMNSFMIRNNIDVVHLGSAAKYGHIDSQVVATNDYTSNNGAQFYNEEGDFNDVNLDEDVTALTSYLDYRYMKHQLEIHNTPKETITNSTQSMKIILSNTMNNGVPIDVDMTLEEWELELETNKEELSPLYKLAQEYKDILSSIVNQNIDKLIAEIGSNTSKDVQNLIDVLKKAANDRNEAENILDAIDLFFDSQTIETLPNRNKVENLLFSLVSNRAVKFKRPGNAVPQISGAGFETENRKRNKEGKLLSNDDALSYYTMSDDNTRLEPAEAIMPLPKNMLDDLVRISGKPNIVSAIDWLNNKINTDDEWKKRVTWKTLRIPNQQLGSNGVYRIKKFLLPTNESFIVVPSENVVKTGGDFDIDKLFIYMKQFNEGLREIKGKTTVTKKAPAKASNKTINIYAGTNENAELSNFAKRPFHTDNTDLYISDIEELKFNNVEAAFQAYKVIFKKENKHKLPEEFSKEDINLIKSFTTMTGSQAKKAGRKIQNLDIKYWDSLSKDIMKSLIRESFEQNPKALDQLLATGNATLTHTQDKGKWGKLFPKILMEVRGEFAKEHGVVQSEVTPTTPKETDNKNAAYNRLLDIENEILLNKANAHVLLAPLVDDILSVAAKEAILKYKSIAAKEEITLDKTTPNEIVEVWKNILKAIHFVGGKTGVGQVATEITGHSVSTMDFVQLADEYMVGVGTKKQRMVSTSLPFSEYSNNNMNRLYDSKGFNILEVLSALLTSQVDVGNNPYPVELGINNQTLNVITYLIRRGMPILDTLLFVSQPLTQEYLKKQRINESAIYEANNLSKMRFQLIEEVADLSENDLKYTKELLEKGNLKFTNQQLIDGVSGKGDSYQKEMFLAFVHIVDQTKVFSEFKRDMTPDTKRLKDLNTFERVKENEIAVMQSGIVNMSSYRDGILKAFFRARDQYGDLFLKYFLTRSKRLGETADTFEGYKQLLEVGIRGEDDKIKMRNTMDNDLLLYVLHNRHPDFQTKKFSSMMSGPKSLPKRIKSIKDNENHALYNNYAIEEFFPELRNADDQMPGASKLDNMRLFNRTMTTNDINDLHDAMKEIMEEDYQLFKDMVVFNFYQQGMNNSPFNFDRILPVDYRFQLMQFVAVSLETRPPNIKAFFDKFLLNHPELLPNNAKYAKYLKLNYFARYNPKTGNRDIFRTKDEQRVAKLGDRSYIRYNADETPIDASDNSYKVEIIEITDPADQIRILDALFPPNSTTIISNRANFPDATTEAEYREEIKNNLPEGTQNPDAVSRYFENGDLDMKC